VSASVQTPLIPRLMLKMSSRFWVRMFSILFFTVLKQIETEDNNTSHNREMEYGSIFRRQIVSFLNDRYIVPVVNIICFN
jgi:hypothetical protein